MTIKIEPGQRVGRLVVIERAGVDGRGRRRWRCKCDCGNEVVRTASQIGGSNGPTRSCGCLSKERGREGHANPNYKHGMWQTAEYRIWAGITRRGRRITVCPDWRNSFEAFFRDIGARPSPDMSLTRINSDHGYFPGNVRWATKSEQSGKRRRSQAAEISRERELYPAAGEEDNPIRRVVWGRRFLAATVVVPPSMAERLNTDTLAVLAVIRDEAKATGKCDLPVARIAERANIGRAKVRAAIRLAESLGAIATENAPGPKRTFVNLCVTSRC